MLPKKFCGGEWPPAGAAPMRIPAHCVRTPSFARQHAQAAGASLLAISCNPYQHFAALPAQGAGVAGELVHVIPQRDAQVNALRGAPSQVGGWSVAAFQRCENQLCRSGCGAVPCGCSVFAALWAPILGLAIKSVLSRSLAGAAALDGLCACYQSIINNSYKLILLKQFVI